MNENQCFLSMFLEQNVIDHDWSIADGREIKTITRRENVFFFSIVQACDV